MIAIDWLNKLLEPNRQGEITKQVWRYLNKVIVTNGFALIVINADLVDCTNLDQSYHQKIISEIINHEYSSQNVKVDLQEFKKFLGDPEGAKECDCKNVIPICPECNGKGTVECNLGEDHECTECEGGSEDFCSKCVDGWIKPKSRYISIFGKVFNANVLAQYLQGLHDDNVIMLCDGDNPVKISGNEWDVYIMPIKDVRQDVRKFEQKG